MIILIESIILCIVFTVIVYIISRNPIKTLYNYPPKIQERIKSQDYYKEEIPKETNKIFAKIIASILFLSLLSILLKYVNGYETFQDAFLYGFLLWTIVNLYDLVVLDIIWFCHDKYFILKGSEDMIEEYHNYRFHFKGFLIGEILGLIICFLSGIIIQFIFGII